MTKEGTLLIVDDTPQNLKVLLNFLEKQNFRILVAKTGEEAIKRAKRFKPDIILLDVRMPGMSGFETCCHLKKDKVTRDIPVLFITALTETDDKIKGFEVGGVDYITKPFHQQEVLARINTHLKLYKTQNHLQQLNSFKDKFFSIVAHDLINPFAGLMNVCEVLIHSDKELECKDRMELYHGIYATCKQSHIVLQNLLQWSKSQSGFIEPQCEVVSLKELIQTNITLLRPNINEKNLDISDNIPTNTIVWVDWNMIDTVVRNLLTNAVKYTPHNGRITVTVEDQQNFVQLNFYNTGVGIVEKDIDKLFRFEKGSGLGLILCKEFVNKNGGEIWATSEQEKGSCFMVTLPKENHK